MEAAELTRRREALGLSRAHLARWVGVSIPTVWRWETDRSKPIPALERVLEQTLAQLELERTRPKRAKTVGGYVSPAEAERIVLDMMSPPEGRDER